jgi:hypothetical protein
VIETLTAGWMIPSGTNSPPGEVDTVIETLTSGRMIPSGTNSLPVEVSPSDRSTDYWADDTSGD